ncbi:MAG: von Willebrand factor type A domain-containing protein, partial [Pseudomonas sp.]|uniref:VWA domain-containing protein n=2 Tax=Pseudomonas TaxID=286 RepID=UPI003982C592
MSAYPVLLTRPLLAGFAAGVLISLGACSAANPEAPATEAGSPQLSDQSDDRERAELHEQLAAAPAELQRKSQVAGRAMMPSVAYTPMPMSVQADALPPGYRDENREQYQKLADNPVHAVAETPVSTFSIDVDTGSYANVRRFLNGGQLPPQDAVRLEELVNYFPYAYPLPKSDVPFGVHTELAATPWNPQSRLLRIAIKASDLRVEELPPANLVFLVDVSGSMDRRDGLPMVQSTLKLLVEQLRVQDKVSLVVYAGSSSVVLEPTSGSEKSKIRAAIDQLTAGGSTAGESG